MRPSTFRLIEYAGILLFFLQFCLLLNHVFQSLEISLFLALISIFAALLTADFISGLVHWFADTCGNESWPIVGPHLILPFRLHHLDPKSILEHDFIETNGSLFLLTNITLAFGLYSDSSLIQIYFLVFSLFTAFTNQFHKYAHSGKTPRFISFLLKARLVLSQRHHRLHHLENQTRAYCITNGWLNSLLDRTNFFRTLEKILKINQ